MKAKAEFIGCIWLVITASRTIASRATSLSGKQDLNKYAIREKLAVQNPPDCGKHPKYLNSDNHEHCVEVTL